MPITRRLADAATGPLKGLRILDLTSVLNGAYATQILADQGADVIKVEDPGSGVCAGDILRWAGDVPEGAPRDMGPLFLTINRNKRSVLLDLKQASARQQLLRLSGSCDVFASSIRYEGLQRLGLDYEQVQAVRPDIIYVHAAGFGSEGPYGGEPAYDDLIQSLSGFADLLPRTDGDPSPRLVPTAVADKVAGLFMAQAVTAALLHRERTGEGQFIEVPMLECVTSFVMVEHLYDHVFEPPTGPYGYVRVLNPNRKPFRTQDGYVGVLPYTDRQWQRFFEATGIGAAIREDSRFASFVARSKHTRELYAIVEEAMATKTTEEWLCILKPLSIPVARVNRLDEVETDPHIEAVGLFETHEHAELGRYKQIRPPVKFSKTPANIRRHPPRLGEHTEEVLRESLSLCD